MSTYVDSCTFESFDFKSSFHLLSVMSNGLQVLVLSSPRHWASQTMAKPMSQTDHDMAWIGSLLDLYWIYKDDHRIFEVPTHLYCSLRRSMTPSKTQNRATKESNSIKEPVSQVLEKRSTGLFRFRAKVKHSVSGESEKPVPAAPYKQSSSARKGLTLQSTLWKSAIYTSLGTFQ